LLVIFAHENFAATRSSGERNVNETQARTVLLVKAFEEAGPELISRAERVRASREAEPPEEKRSLREGGPVEDRWTPEEERFLAARAALLRGALERKFPAVHSALRQAQWRSWFTPAAIGAAFLLGLAANKLGPDQRISILAFPLLAMLVWNLAVYLVLLIRNFRSFLHKNSAGRHETMAAGIMRWWLRPRVSSAQVSSSDEPLQSALRRFAGSWLNWGAPLHSARARSTLHFAAAFFAIGLIGGMYLRGLAYEYLAGWESTFLNAEQVRLFLGWVLGPASLLTGIDIPDANHLATLRWGAGQTGENAARWIHLYAATAALVVIGPRLLLGVGAGIKALRLRARFPFSGVQEPYFRRLLSQGQGEGVALSILPYSFAPEAQEKETLRSLLADWLGWNSQIVFQPPVGYGAEDDYLKNAVHAGDNGHDYLALLFNMAATPEEENHGLFISGMKERSARGKGPRHLLLILDESSYRRRLREEPGLENRLAGRRKAWEKLARDCGLDLLSLDLGNASLAMNPDQFRAALWTAPRFDPVP
jgi:hypothetical protein